MQKNTKRKKNAKTKIQSDKVKKYKKKIKKKLIMYVKSVDLLNAPEL